MAYRNKRATAHISIKRSISALLAITLLATYPTTAYGLYDNAGGYGEVIVGEGTWHSSKQGYRISIIDSEGELIAGKDYLNSAAPAGSDVETDYTNKLGDTVSENYMVIDTAQIQADTGTILPEPVTVISDKLIGQGEDMKQWLVAGKSGIGSSGSGSGGGEYGPPSEGGGGGSKPSGGGDTSSGSSDSNSEALRKIEAITKEATEIMNGFETTMLKNLTVIKLRSTRYITEIDCWKAIDDISKWYTKAQYIAGLNSVYTDAEKMLKDLYGGTIHWGKCSTALRNLVVAKTTIEAKWPSIALAVTDTSQAVFARLRAIQLGQIKGPGNRVSTSFSGGTTRSQDGKSIEPPRPTAERLDTVIPSTAAQQYIIPLEGPPEPDPIGGGGALSGSNADGKMDYMLGILFADDPTWNDHKQSLMSSGELDGKMVNGVAIDGNTASEIEIIVAMDYKIMVEPVYWLIPVSLSWERGVSTVYGTVTNIADYQKKCTIEWMGSDYGGNMANLTNRVGATALILIEDITLGEHSLVAGDRSKTELTYDEILAESSGYGVQIYSADMLNAPSGDSTQTYDPKPGTPPEHPAPVPPTPTPENPDDTDDPDDTGDTGDPASYNINIVKFYEAGGVPISNHTRELNPSTIKVMDELVNGYDLADWSISDKFNQPLSPSDSYGDTISGLTIDSSGKTPTTVTVTEPNTTLYVKLIKGGLVGGSENDLVIRESEVTKAISTIEDVKNSEGVEWGSRDWVYTYGSLYGRGSHSCSYTHPHSGSHKDNDCEYSLTDRDWAYTFKNSTDPQEGLLANEGVFTPIADPGAKASGKRDSIYSGTDIVSTYDYQMALWRGTDNLTIAQYKPDANSATLLELVGRTGNKAVGERKPNAPYYDNIVVTMEGNPKVGDYTTASAGCSDHGTSTTHKTNSSYTYNGLVTIEVYAGKKGDTGNAKPNSTQFPYISTKGTQARKGSGRSTESIAKGEKQLAFYPYINMTYQLPGHRDQPKQDVAILSQWERSLIPQDYAEAGWYSKNDINLNLNSTQWSLHQKAMNPTDTGGNLLWSKPSDVRKNNVLPGGALYTLDTKSADTADTTVVAAVTWQTYINEAERNALSKTIDISELTLEQAKAEHIKYTDTAKKVIEGLRVVQYVSKDSKADNAFDGGTVILGGGQSLSDLGLPNTTNTDLKYYPRADTASNKAYEGDIDIIGIPVDKIVYYGVKSDTSGNVTVMRGTTSDMSGAEEIDTLAKGQKANALKSRDGKELDDKTKLVSNFITAIERNTGNDKTASWAPDGAWYNEAWDGFCVIRQETTYVVGFKGPAVRSSALDPALCPSNAGQSDLFSKAYLSQFRMNSVSDAAEAAGKEVNYFSTFKGKDIKMVGMEGIFTSKKFWIPNVNVQDLK